MTRIFTSWWSSRQRSSRNQPMRRGKSNRRRARFALEHLEDRSLPSSATLGWSAALGDTTAPAWASAVAVATDAAGDVYTVGNYSGGFAAPSSSTVLFSSQAGGSGIYLAKYSRSGAFDWAVNVGSATVEQAYGVAAYTNPTTGLTSVYVVGSTGVETGANRDVQPNFFYNGDAAVVWELNGAGSLNWTASVPGVVATSVAVDGSGNAYVASNSALTMFNASSATPVSLATFNFAGGGSFGNPVTSVATATVGGIVNVYLGGAGAGSLTTASGTTTIKTGSVCIVDLTVTGGKASFRWSSYFDAVGGILWDGYITADSSGDVYATGNFAGTVNFVSSTSSSGTGVVSGSSLGDEGTVCLAKWSPTGAFDWADAVASPPTDAKCAVVTGITADSSGVYITGAKAGKISFNPADPNGTNSADYASDGTTFVAKYNTSGVFQWVVDAALNAFTPAAVAVDSFGDVVVTSTLPTTDTALLYEWTQSS